MTVAEKIRTLRKEAGLNQTELGELLGVQKNAVSKWECGRVDEIPSSKIKAMAAIFHVPPSYLIDDDIEDIHLIVSSADPQITAIVETARLLNAQGLQRLSQYADDLARIPAYQKKKSPTPISAGVSRRVAARGGVVVDQDHPADDDAFLKAIAESEPPETV